MNDETQYLMTKQNSGQSPTDSAPAAPSKNSLAPDPPTIADCKVPAEDLMLEFDIRVWGRHREIFKQHRVVSIWKGAIPSAVHRSLATSDIAFQLKHLLEAVLIEMRQYTKEVNPGGTPKLERKFRSPIHVFDVSNLTADFKEADQTAKMPILDDLNGPRRGL